MFGGEEKKLQKVVQRNPHVYEGTYINGNFETFRRLYHELNKDARRDFMDFLLSEVEPTYWREILKQTI